MKLSKRQLKQIIREEYSRLKRRGLIRESLSNNPMNGQLGGKIGNPYGGDTISLVRSLNNAVTSLDHGDDPEEIAHAEETLERVREEMSPADFKVAKELADLYVYYANYATDMDHEMIEKEIEELCIQLGMTLDDVI